MCQENPTPGGGRIKQSSGAICAVKRKSDFVQPVCVYCHWQWEVASVYMTTSCSEHLSVEMNMATRVGGKVEEEEDQHANLWESLGNDAGSNSRLKLIIF